VSAIALTRNLKPAKTGMKTSMRERYSQLAKDILIGLAFAGSFAIMASSTFFLLPLLKEASDEYIRKKIKEKRAGQIFERLKKRKLIILKEKEGGNFVVELTEKGKRKVKEIQFENLQIEKPKVWDKKWRVVIFDIPDKFKRKARDALRKKLKELGFYPFQKSVWVIPYPCEKEIQFLCELFKIRPYVNIIVAESIDNDIKLKKYFGLL